MLICSWMIIDLKDWNCKNGLVIPKVNTDYNGNINDGLKAHYGIFSIP